MVHNNVTRRRWSLTAVLHLIALVRSAAFLRPSICFFKYRDAYRLGQSHEGQPEPQMLHEMETERSQQQHGRQLGAQICEYHEVKIPSSQSGPPRQAICVEDLTPTLQTLLQKSGIKHGVVTVISRHTTTAITINERESRLVKDMEHFFLQLVPPDERSVASTTIRYTNNRSADNRSIRYFHNDIHLRPDGEEEAQRCRENGWDIDQPHILEQWRDQEPINAHSHLLVMLLGSSESIPVHEGRMVIGQWQSVLLVDCDAPRDRTVGIQFMGYK